MRPYTKWNKSKNNSIQSRWTPNTVDKRIIADLEKEIHFLKNEIETKNEIIKNFIKNDPHRDENNDVTQKMGKFRCLHVYQMTQIPM